MVFLMQDPGCRRHPLHIAFPDHSAVARTVVVGDPAFVCDGYRFKSPVRMYAHTPRCIRRRKIMRRPVIKHDEGVHAFHVQVIAAGDKIVHPETIADIMGLPRRDYDFD